MVTTVELARCTPLLLHDCGINMTMMMESTQQWQDTPLLLHDHGIGIDTVMIVELARCAPLLLHDCGIGTIVESVQ